MSITDETIDRKRKSSDGRDFLADKARSSSCDFDWCVWVNLRQNVPVKLDM